MAISSLSGSTSLSLIKAAFELVNMLLAWELASFKREREVKCYTLPMQEIILNVLMGTYFPSWLRRPHLGLLLQGKYLGSPGGGGTHTILNIRWQQKLKL